jgi:hypothetical protein
MEVPTQAWLISRPSEEPVQLPNCLFRQPQEATVTIRPGLFSRRVCYTKPALLTFILLSCSSAPLVAQVSGEAGGQRVTPVQVPSVEILRGADGEVLEARPNPNHQVVFRLALTKEAIAAKQRAERGEAFPTAKPELAPGPETPRGALPKFRALEGLALGNTANSTANGAVLTGPFQGVAFNGSLPPDPAIAAGPANLVVTANGTMNVFDKSGTMLSSQTLRNFFSNVLRPTDSDPSDPHPAYDAYIGRFWFVALSVNDSAMTSSLLVGLSNSNDATAGWTVFSLDAKVNGSTDSGLWCDYPQIGIDAQAVYFTCNMAQFPTATGTLQYAKLRVMTKDQFMNGTCCRWSDFFNTSLTEGSSIPATSIAPARMYGATASDGEFLVEAHGSGANGSALEVFHVTNPQVCCILGNQSSPTLSQATQSVLPYDAPPGAQQPGTTVPINTGDTRLQFAIWKNGDLFTAHNIASSSGQNSGAAFVELDVSRFPSMITLNDWVLAQTGTDYFYPAADVDASGTKVMVFNRSSPSVFAGAAFLGIPPSSVCQTCFDGPEQTLQDGQSTYVLLDTTGTNRWGDFSGAATDPSGTGVWVHGEFAASMTNTWGTEVAFVSLNDVGTGPGVGTNADGRVEVFVRGVDNALWHRWQPVAGGPDWSGWTSLGGILTSDPVVAQNADGRLEVFIRGNDAALWHISQIAPSATTWNAWSSLGGGLIGNAGVARNADGRLEVFLHGIDNALWHNAQMAGGGPAWTGWTSLGGILTSDPVVAQNADGRLEVFIRGRDGALWHTAQATASAATWNPWSSLGGGLTGAAGVARNADGRLEVFIRGFDNALWHSWQLAAGGPGWSGWIWLDGILTSGPVVGQNLDGRLEVFVRGNDSALWHISQTTPSATTWNPWSSLGGALTSGVGVVANADRRLEVFVRGVDNALWHNFQLGAGGPDWLGWASLDGAVVTGVSVQVSVSLPPPEFGWKTVVFQKSKKLAIKGLPFERKQKPRIGGRL